jgi:hypothetical protein
MGFFGGTRNPKKLPLEGFGPLNQRCERRTRVLPEVSGGGERHGTWTGSPGATYFNDNLP